MPFHVFSSHVVVFPIKSLLFLFGFKSEFPLLLPVPRFSHTEPSRGFLQWGVVEGVSSIGACSERVFVLRHGGGFSHFEAYSERGFLLRHGKRFSILRPIVKGIFYWGMSFLLRHGRFFFSILRLIVKGFLYWVVVEGFPILRSMVERFFCWGVVESLYYGGIAGGSFENSFR